jgi:hypothetical protein
MLGVLVLLVVIVDAAALRERVAGSFETRADASARITS